MDVRLGPDRQAAIAAVLAKADFTPGELAQCVQRLSTCEVLDEKLRFDKERSSLTAADFIRVRPRRRTTEEEQGAKWLKRAEQFDVEHGRDSDAPAVSADWIRKKRAAALQGTAGPRLLEEKASRDEHEVTKRCPDHPDRQLFADGFCAECEVEQIDQKKRAPTQ